MGEAPGDWVKTERTGGPGGPQPGPIHRRHATPPASGHLERRSGPRFTVLDPRGWVGWWAEGDFHEEAEVRLLDVGEFGAAVEVDRPLPRDCPLFLSLNSATVTESIEAEVVATQPGRGKKYLVRLAFASRCPVRLLAAIIHGPAATTTRTPATDPPSPPALDADRGAR